MKVRQAILDAGTYRPPLEGRDPQSYLLMDFNESMDPPAPHVSEALIEFIHSNQLQVYPAYGDFLDTLSTYTGATPEQLILTNGSDQGIDIVLRALLGEGNEMVLAKPGFSMFFQVAATLGAQVISPHYDAEMRFPFQEIVEAVTDKTRLIVVINPNNPTGTSASMEQIEALLKQFPDIGVLVDEAYFEHTGQSSFPLLKDHNNLIILRTFSKAFAIPSLRLGYAMAHPDFIQQLYKIRGPYDVNILSVVAARAQLENPSFWQKRIRHTMEEAKPLLEQFFETHQVKYYKGDAHFMLVEPPDVEETVNYLEQHGILVRRMKPPVDHTFRINVGSVSQTQKFIDVYKELVT